MKSKLVFVLCALIGLTFTAEAQEVQLQQITLYSKISYRDSTRSMVNFESAKRGTERWDQMLDFDLIFGNLAVNYNSDWFEVSDPRSVIIDLGKKQWADIKKTPSLPPIKKPYRPLPLDAPKVLGGSVDSPHRQFAQVKANHMYLMKVIRGRTKTYVMFRVDKLITQDNCVLSWKKVPPPADDIEK
jgi:hypothetical protein